MVNDTARILKTVGKRSKKVTGYQGLRLGTITSVEPFKMTIDDIGCEFLSEDVLVNAQMLDFTYSASLSAEQFEITGNIDVNGNATVDGYSRSFTMNSANTQISGNAKTENAVVVLKKIFQANDRVAVASVGMNKFLILCKVVGLQ